MNIAELRDAYMLRLEAENRSPNTLRAYQSDLRQFARFVGPDRDIETIDRAVLRRYFARYSASSLRRKFAVLRCCMEEAINLGKLSANPFEGVYTPKVAHRLPYCPSESDVLRALDAHYSPEFSSWPLRDKALLELAYSTMARVDELHGMNVDDINWSLRTIRVTGKGDKQRLVLFGEPAELVLRAYLRERELLLRTLGTQTDALFLNRSRRESGSRMAVRRLYSTIKRVCVGVGMSKKIHPHSFRRAGATHMLNRGADLRTIKALLGHELLMTTAGYARLAPERLRSVLDSTHPDNR